MFLAIMVFKYLTNGWEFKTFCRVFWRIFHSTITFFFHFHSHSPKVSWWLHFPAYLDLLKSPKNIISANKMMVYPGEINHLQQTPKIPNSREKHPPGTICVTNRLIQIPTNQLAPCRCPGWHPSRRPCGPWAQRARRGRNKDLKGERKMSWTKFERTFLVSWSQVGTNWECKLNLRDGTECVSWTQLDHVSTHWDVCFFPIQADIFLYHGFNML